MSEAPIKSRVARETRSALPVSAAALQAAVKAKANASSQAATITALIRVAAAVAMVAPLIFFVQWVRVPNTHRLPQMR
jgi:hypothetical protein